MLTLTPRSHSARRHAETVLRAEGHLHFMLALAPKLGRHLLAKEERPEPGIPEWFIKSHPDYKGHLGPRTDWEVCDSFSKMIKFLLLTT